MMLEKIDMDNMTTREKLALTLTTLTINKDSVSRDLPQDSYLFLEFFVTNLVGHIFAGFHLALHKQRDEVVKCNELLDALIVDIKAIQQEMLDVKKEKH